MIFCKSCYFFGYKLHLVLLPVVRCKKSVAVKTAQGTAVITGWCCQQENFDPPIEFKEKGFPFTIGAAHTNPVQLYESTRRVMDLADVIIPCHEYESLINIKAI